MKLRTALPLLLALTAPLMPQCASATTIDFESLASTLTTYAGPIDGPVDGYVFSANTWIVDEFYYNVRFHNVPYPLSGDIGANALDDAPIILSKQDGGVFSLQNLIFSSWDTASQDRQGTFTATGYLNGVEVASASAQSAQFNWSTLTANFRAVDKVVFEFNVSQGANTYPFSFVIDNVNVSAVPQPSTYAMLLGGLVLLGCTARRQSHNKT
ncbi:PEP-CTERM sorting domain-containing protein [Duganella guangzhouensis]|uniref:PEP-CTERM sorting domain-containing protein n=1 Tax=Duganella guangzhouensis TaxID=2666084 RepID=UPI0018A209D4|nr:PEP-CTERM sorting domain-containing protein [Duganella guangzhouensis]